MASPSLLSLPGMGILLLVSIVAANGAPVLDTDGNPVIRGMPYYVLAPQVRGQGNLGLSFGGSCPLDVFLKPYPYGPAAMFFPERSGGDSSVLVGENLYVMSATPTKCSTSTLWKLDDKTGIVTTGGSSTEYAQFRIARYPIRNRNFYQFLSYHSGISSKLGVTTEQLLRRTDEVLVVSFMKVKEGAA